MTMRSESGNFISAPTTCISLLFCCCMVFVFMPASFASDDLVQQSGQTGQAGHEDEMLSLRWKDHGSQITYLFQMARDRQFQHIYYEKKSERPEIIFMRPTGAGTYYVRIGLIPPDEGKVFFLPPQILALESDVLPPHITEPVEMSEIRGKTSLTLKWQKVARASGYNVVLAKDRQFLQILFEYKCVSDNSITVPTADYGTYFLKISTLSNEGIESAFSDIRTFIVVPH